MAILKIIKIEERRVIWVTVKDSDSQEIISTYTADGWEYCDYTHLEDGDNGLVVELKFSKAID